MSKKKEDLKNKAKLCLFDDDSLIFELSSRGYTCLEDSEYVDLLTDIDDDKESNESGCYDTSGFPQYFSIERMKAFGNDLREHLLEITGQGHYVTNEQLLNELRDLL